MSVCFVLVQRLVIPAAAVLWAVLVFAVPATGAQQTAQNWLGGMSNADAPVTDMLNQTPGATGQQNINRVPGT